MKQALLSKKIMCPAISLALILLSGCAARMQYRQGLNALEKGDYFQAVDYLEKATRQNPENLEISIALERARFSAAAAVMEKAQQCLDEEDYSEAKHFLEMAVLYDPGYPGIRKLLDDIDNRRKAEQAYEEGLRFERENNWSSALQCYRETLRVYPMHEAATDRIETITRIAKTAHTGDPIIVSFQIDDMRLGDVFSALASVAALNLLIDDSVDQDRLLSINLKDVDVLQVMEDIAATYGLMIVKLESNTRILCADIPENRERFGTEDVRLFPLQYADADRIRVLLEPVADMAVVLADERTNAVVVRTRPDQMRLVSELIQALDIRESEVLVEVEILEITRSRLEDIGLDFGENALLRASLGGAVKQSGSAGTLTLSELSDITGGQIFLTVPSLYMKLIKKDSHTRILAQPRLRIVNRTPARLHIGEQIPIKVTSSLFRNTSEELSSYQYRDVGIVMNMTPRILSASELALDLKLAVSAITREGEEGHPTIGTREVETTLRLRNGEVEIIAGLIKEDERKGSIKLPLLGEVPVLGRLFRSESGQATQTDIVISLTPHILDRRTLMVGDTPLWRGDIRSGHASGPPSSARSPRASVPGDRVMLDETETPGGTTSGSTGDTSSGSPESEPEAPAITVSVQPVRTELTVNASSDITIDIENAVNVGSVPFYIDYDPNILEILDVREGPFMGSDGMSTVFMSSIDDRRGRIIIGLSRIGAGAGISGSGTLVEITAGGKSPGESPVAFSHESVLDPMAQSIPAVFTDGDVVVSGDQQDKR
jgi:general secretion pathway protein D